MILKPPWAQTRMSRGLEKGIFKFCANILTDEVKTVFWQNEANRSKLFKSKFGYMDFLENGFGAILS